VACLSASTSRSRLATAACEIDTVNASERMCCHLPYMPTHNSCM
jgi:hypothetical protein